MNLRPLRPRTQCSTRLSYTPAKAAHIAPRVGPGKAQLSRAASPTLVRSRCDRRLSTAGTPSSTSKSSVPRVAAKSLRDRRLDRCQEGGGRAGHVADQDRLGMQSELAPGDDLDCFIQRPQATRQRTKASAASNMRCLRLCIKSVTTILVTPACATSRRVRNSGMMPRTSPPAASAASARTPISPMRPPPYTSRMPAFANPVPSACAVQWYAGSFPEREPQNTVTA